jgi:hypothetical protein
MWGFAVCVLVLLGITLKGKYNRNLSSSTKGDLSVVIESLSAQPT